MQILIVLPTLSNGGAERVLINLANGLSVRHSTEILVLDDSYTDLASKINDKVRLTSLGKLRVRNSMKPLNLYLKQNPKDVVISTLVHLNIIMCILSLYPTSHHRLIVRETNSRKGIYGLLERLIRVLYFPADYIVFPSEEMRTKNWFYGKRSITIRNPFVFNGLSNKQYFDRSKTNFLLVGKMIKQKNFSFVLNCLATAECSDNCHFNFVGDGPLLDDLKNMVVTLGLENNVTFHGYSSDVHSMFYAADVFILSSLYEGMPNVLIEALSFGCLVISAKIATGVTELAANEVNMHLYASNNQEEFNELIIRFQDYKKLDNLIDSRKYSIDEFISNFEAIAEK